MEKIVPIGSRTYKEELKIAERAVLIATKICQEVRSNLKESETATKDDASPVTIADYASQAIICKALYEAYPNDPVIAEEDSTNLIGNHKNIIMKRIQELVQKASGENNSSISNDEIIHWIDHGSSNSVPTSSVSRFWTLDPIDGTKGFLRGDQYAIALALIENGDVKLGILACPALRLDNMSNDGCIFTAIRGQGTFVKSICSENNDTRRVNVVQARESKEMRFVESVEAGHCNHTVQKKVAEAIGITNDPVRIDSQAKYGLVAAGGAALYLRIPSHLNKKEKIWDHAAGCIVVEEAGGVVTDMDGKLLDFCSGESMNSNRGVIVSNGKIHEHVLHALEAA